MTAGRPEWLATAGNDLPIDAEAMFPEGDGLLERRRAAQRAKRIARLRPVLARLEPGETVRFVTLGVRYRFAEFYFSGYLVAHQANLTALVLTDRRLLLVACAADGKPHDVKTQIRLERLRTVRPRSLFGGMYVEADDGEKHFYTSTPRRDVLRLQALVGEKAAAPAAGPSSPAAGPALERLCPACLAVVPGPAASAEQCPRPDCRIPFRSASRAARLSALVPGVGDIYLRHFGFGALEFLGSTLMLCFAIVLAGELVATREPALAVLLVALVGLPRLIDYFLTLHMGRKGYVPLSDRPAPGGQARNLPAFPAWALALFAAGGLAVVGTAAASSIRVRERASFTEALSLAREGRFDEAMSAFGVAEKRGAPDDGDRARMALALLRAGDVTDAEHVLVPLARKPIDAALAHDIDAEYERYQRAFERHDRAMEALARGDEKAAWAELDPVLPVLASVHRPAMPRTRAEAALHGAHLVLDDEESPPGLAERLLGVAERAGAPAAEVAELRARLDAQRPAGGKPR